MFSLIFAEWWRIPDNLTSGVWLLRFRSKFKTKKLFHRKNILFYICAVKKGRIRTQRVNNIKLKTCRHDFDLGFF